MSDLRKIVLTGPESSGKSWLAQNLARHFNEPWAPEYARIYLEEHGSNYTFDTLEQIIKGHLAHQQKYIEKTESIIFLDTDLINFEVWEEVVFSKTHDFLEKAIQKEHDHLYLLTYPDLPWEADPLRENRDNRLEIFERHKMEIEKRGRAYKIIRHQNDHRLTHAIEAVNNLLK
jgi:NadR type nicotinamide-nucleotide adenylyltransferase